MTRLARGESASTGLEPDALGIESGAGTEVRVYYPELDGVRFFAYLAVFVFHGGWPQLAGMINAALEGLRAVAPALVPFKGPILAGATVRANGWTGVQLFYVLSGYLITSLLLREERRYGRIDLGAFWMRRILRIWPLYYVCVLIGFFVLPASDGLRWGDPTWVGNVERHLSWFLLFLGNWSMGMKGPVPYDELSILWSVSVEEQFYILCPLALLVTPKRLRIPLALGLMVWAVYRRAENALLVQRQAITPLLFQFSTVTQLDTLLGGVLLALVLGAGPVPRWVTWLAVPAQVVGPLIIAGLVFRAGLGQAWTRETGARDVWEVSLEFTALWIGFACVIGAVVLHEGWLRRFLGWRAFAWLGRISYGLYMYHILAIRMGRGLFGRLPWFANKEWWETIFIFVLNVGISAVSYYTLERFFLRLKSRWTRVPSRPV